MNVVLSTIDERELASVTGGRMEFPPDPNAFFNQMQELLKLLLGLFKKPQDDLQQMFQMVMNVVQQKKGGGKGDPPATKTV